MFATRLQIDHSINALLNEIEQFSMAVTTDDAFRASIYFFLYKKKEKRCRKRTWIDRQTDRESEREISLIIRESLRSLLTFVYLDRQFDYIVDTRCSICSMTYLVFIVEVNLDRFVNCAQIGLGKEHRMCWLCSRCCPVARKNWSIFLHWDDANNSTRNVFAFLITNIDIVRWLSLSLFFILFVWSKSDLINPLIDSLA
jgi:predicted nucleic acid-binding Zn finger protein